MKYLLILLSLYLTGCSVVPSNPTNLNHDAKIGVINLVGDKAQSNYWGITIFSNFSSSEQVDWSIREYIDEGIRARIEGNSDYSVVLIKDPSLIEDFRSPLLNSFSRFTANSKLNLSKVKEKYGVDILILVNEGLSYVGDEMYANGYGVHGLRSEGFVHANVSIYSIDLRTQNLFFPATLNGISTKPLKGLKSVPLPDVVHKNDKSFILSSTVEKFTKELIDSSLNWYFSLFPVNPPLKQQMHDKATYTTSA